MTATAARVTPLQLEAARNAAEAAYWHARMSGATHDEAVLERRKTYTTKLKELANAR